MMIPLPIQQSVSKKLNVRILKFSFAAGGCINHGGRMTTTNGHYFLKWNYVDQYPGMLAAERKGLNILANSKKVNVPKVIHTDIAGEYQYIVMEFIQSFHRSKSYWEDFGEQLALLHQCSYPTFGLDHDNYIGSLPQRNHAASSWDIFFAEHRLNPMLQKLKDADRIQVDLIRSFEQLYPKLSEVFPYEPPSLLHGDLWSGNLMIDDEGNPCVIDPAVFYGHREAELAFTKLFGGFQKSFYEAYNAVFPLSPGFEKRVDLYNLYPLLVHAVLFGDSYLMDVRRIIKSFSS